MEKRKMARMMEEWVGRWLRKEVEVAVGLVEDGLMGVGDVDDLGMGRREERKGTWGQQRRESAGDETTQARFRNRSVGVSWCGLSLWNNRGIHYFGATFLACAAGCVIGSLSRITTCRHLSLERQRRRQPTYPGKGAKGWRPDTDCALAGLKAPPQGNIHRQALEADPQVELIRTTACGAMVTTRVKSISPADYSISGADFILMHLMLSIHGCLQA